MGIVVPGMPMDPEHMVNHTGCMALLGDVDNMVMVDEVHMQVDSQGNHRPPRELAYYCVQRKSVVYEEC